jgi:hypothetical protein
MSAWAPTVYFLCFLSSALCAGLLVRSYLHNKTKLLLWSAACFVLLALNNLGLFVDLVLLPTSIDLAPLRSLLGFAAVATLLYGFIWELD